MNPRQRASILKDLQTRANAAGMPMGMTLTVVPTGSPRALYFVVHVDGVPPAPGSLDALMTPALLKIWLAGFQAAQGAVDEKRAVIDGLTEMHRKERAELNVKIAGLEKDLSDLQVAIAAAGFGRGEG